MCMNEYTSTIVFVETLKHSFFIVTYMIHLNQKIGHGSSLTDNPYQYRILVLI